ncbi:MAG: hypothetical protein IKQ07_06935, partial [Bacteroidaceae bacterium]|nr:hypothetical protein [Bacteroidaceae bacterium]
MVRYQLRYFPSGPKTGCKGTKKSEKRKVKSKKLNAKGEKYSLFLIFSLICLQDSGKSLTFALAETERC